MTSSSLESVTFEQALAELEEIVKSLETGRAPLDESIRLYERGIVLKSHCEKKLEDARLKIEKITISANGTVSTEPFDAS